MILIHAQNQNKKGNYEWYKCCLSFFYISCTEISDHATWPKLAKRMQDEKISDSWGSSLVQVSPQIYLLNHKQGSK